MINYLSWSSCSHSGFLFLLESVLVIYICLLIHPFLFKIYWYKVHKPLLSFTLKIRLIIFFAAKDGEALYSQQTQDQELTVAQTMNTLLPNSDLN